MFIKVLIPALMFSALTWDSSIGAANNRVFDTYIESDLMPTKKLPKITGSHVLTRLLHELGVRVIQCLIGGHTGQSYVALTAGKQYEWLTGGQTTGHEVADGTGILSRVWYGRCGEH